MLRYGDGTPFPHDDGFLDMLEDTVEACTTMLAATADLERLRADAEAVLRVIGEEERRLVLFERAVAAACAPSPNEQPTPADCAAELTRTAMLSAVERSREQLRQLSETKAAPPSWHRTAQCVHAAAGRFFAQRLLPGTSWSWAWDASGPEARAEAASQDARFRVVFDLELPPAWLAPVRIDALAPDLIVQLPRPRWLRSTVEAAIPLGRCLLVGARHDGRGRELSIRKPDGAGWRIELPDQGQPSATAIDRRGRTVGTGLVREGELAALVEAIDRELATRRLPRQAREVMLGDARVTELADTTLAARALLGEIGPTVREIRQRSRMPGELTLKRDVADGVREELYVSRSSLAERYASLPVEHRRLLDDAGFGRGPETASGELAMPAAAPAAAAAPAPASTMPPLEAPVRATPPRQRRDTQPLVAPTPIVPAAPVLPAAAAVLAAARTGVAQAKRRRDEPTLPSILAVARPAVEAAAELSEVVTSAIFPHVRPRRLATPTG